MHNPLPIHILIVEDNRVVANNIEKMLSQFNYKIAGVVADYEAAVVSLKTKPIDLVLIDIILTSRKTGIDLGAYIRKEHDLPFIFITSNSDRTTVENAKTVHPDGYLVKPFEAQDLFTTMEIALFNFEKKEVNNRPESLKKNRVVAQQNILSDSIFIKKQHIYHRIPFTDIQYIKADNVYLEVHTVNKSFLVRSTLKDYFKKLPAKLFYKAHKSYVVNIERIQAINTKDIQIAGKSIPISKDFKDFLINAMNS